MGHNIHDCTHTFCPGQGWRYFILIIGVVGLAGYYIFGFFTYWTAREWIIISYCVIISGADTYIYTFSGVNPWINSKNSYISALTLFMYTCMGNLSALRHFVKMRSSNLSVLRLSVHDFLTASAIILLIFSFSNFSQLTDGRKNADKRR